MSENPLLSAEFRLEQKAICDAATPAPWAYDPRAGQVFGHERGSSMKFYIGTTMGRDEPDMSFLCASRTGYPAALALIGQQAAQLAAKDAEIARLKAIVHSVLDTVGVPRLRTPEQVYSIAGRIHEWDKTREAAEAAKEADDG